MQATARASADSAWASGERSGNHVPATDEAVVVRRLHDAVWTAAPLLQSGADEADRQGFLTPEAVSMLQMHDLWRLRLCRQLGGLELSICAQLEVLAALAEADTSSAWCTMVMNDALAVIGATMPQATIDRVFADGIPSCSIVATPGGVAIATDGGFLLTGSWQLASGIRNATWVYAAAFVDRDPSRVLPFVLPVADVDILDTWNVVGLAGTGSNDFKLNNYFLPAELAGREESPFEQVRGVRRYDAVDVEHLESYEHLAFAIGVARRALREFRLTLSRPSAGRHVGDREMVQEQFGRCMLRLKAIEALALSLYSRIDAATLGEPQAWLDGERHLPRTLAAQSSELALECVQLAFRRSGIAALHRPNIYDKLLRDMNVAATHVVVDDSAFASYAQDLIETGGSASFRQAVPSPVDA